jgi:spore coat polysaccharide biosynthesis predicted glycosyltransferase SpsG
LGYGHVRRTLAVVDGLKKIADVRVCYLMKPDSDARPVEAAGYEVMRLSGEGIAGILEAVKAMDGPLILDTYSLTREEQERLFREGYCTTVFDDGRRLDRYAAHLVVDYAPGADGLSYRGLPTTRFCLGPDYFPLRPEFLGRRKGPTLRRAVENIVVTFGGSDPEDQTARVASLFEEHSHPWAVTVVLGPGYAGRADKSGARGVSFQRNVSDMAQTLAGADLAISGAGGTALELAYLGVPSLLLELSKDQRPIASTLARAGAAINLGWYARACDEEIWRAIEAVAGDPSRRDAMRVSGQRVVDGKGIDRIAQAVLETWRQYRLQSCQERTRC